MFGGFREIRPDRSWHHNTVAICGFTILICLLGYLGSYVDRLPSGAYEWHAFVWDLQTILFTAAMWLFWAGGVFAARYYPDGDMRWGARLFISLPVALFLFFAFGLVKVGL